MGEEPNYLERFSIWLRDLAQEAESLASLIDDGAVPEGTRLSLIAAINYIFKSLDLIPEGIDDVGYLDDAFVLRVAADQGGEQDLLDLDPDKLQVLHRLASDADVVRDFLGKDFARLSEYVKGLRKGSARGPKRRRHPARRLDARGVSARPQEFLPRLCGPTLCSRGEKLGEATSVFRCKTA